MAVLVAELRGRNGIGIPEDAVDNPRGVIRCALSCCASRSSRVNGATAGDESGRRPRFSLSRGESSPFLDRARPSSRRYGSPGFAE